MSEIECCDREDRLQATASPDGLNGIDYINVDYKRQRLYVHLFKATKVANEFVTIADTRESQALATQLVTEDGTPIEEGTSGVLIVRFSVTSEIPKEGRSYRFSLRRVCNGHTSIPDDFDPRFSEVDFTYNETVNAEVDFNRTIPTIASAFSLPESNYLVRDYESFRRLIIDRFATTMPRWMDTHAADLGVTLAELMAYTGDRLSYQQDAVATEAYLETARRRESVRRHARLVDYPMHEGHNSKVLLFVETSDDVRISCGDIFFTTAFPADFQISGNVHRQDSLPPELYQHVVEFEPLQPFARSWKLKRQDIKDVRSFVAIADALGQGRFDFAMGPELTRGQTTVTDSMLDNSIDAANRVLLDADLLAKFPAPTVACEVSTAASSLPLRHRNRAVLDASFADIVSRSGLDGKIYLTPSHNEMHFYTWGEQECTIPEGASSAVLMDSWEPPTICISERSDNQRSQLSRLSVGDFLLLEELIGPRTGDEADANKNHRQFVRLTNVRFTHDPAGGRHNEEPLKGRWRVPLVEIQWDELDRLRFPLCVSVRTQPQNGCHVVQNVSVARGNIVPVDQGRTIDTKELGTVTSHVSQVDCGDGWEDAEVIESIDRFSPIVADIALTYAASVESSISASEFQQTDPGIASAIISLIGIPGVDGHTPVRLDPQDFASGEQFVQRWRGLRDEERHAIENEVGPANALTLSKLLADDLPGDQLRRLVCRVVTSLTWNARRDLIDSSRDDRHFVVENDNERRVRLRFGDSNHGRRPTGGTRFFVTARHGNGAKGNVGAESIVNAVLRRGSASGILRVRNAIASFGGVEPEPLRAVKLHAPCAWLSRQPRASLPEDYVRLVMDEFGEKIQNAKAVIKWVGSYWLVSVAIDQLASASNESALVSEVDLHLNRQRRIGHRVRVVEGTKVPLALGLSVAVGLGHMPEDVRADLNATFSGRTLTSGSLGFFHPDRLTFGQTIHASHIVREARAVPGVVDVRIDFLRRHHEPASPSCQHIDKSGADDDFVSIGDLEIAQLDNTGTIANGYLCLSMRESL